MKILNEKKYKFQCRKCDTEIIFSKKDCWVDRTYEDLWLTCPVCGRRHDNQTYGLFCQEYVEEYDEKDKEIERLNNIINELEKYLNEQIQKSWEIEEQCYENIESKLQELKGSDK